MMLRDRLTVERTVKTCFGIEDESAVS